MFNEILMRGNWYSPKSLVLRNLIIPILHWLSAHSCFAVNIPSQVNFFGEVIMENIMNASVSSVSVTSGAVGLATVQGVCAKDLALG
jgi:hypothetical protein